MVRRMSMSRCSAITKKGTPCKRHGLYQSTNNEFKCGIHIEKLDEDCAICLRKLYNTWPVPCGHQFHTKCILQWLRYKNSCPICRQPLLDEDGFPTEAFINDIFIHIEISPNANTNTNTNTSTPPMEIEWFYDVHGNVNAL